MMSSNNNNPVKIEMETQDERPVKEEEDTSLTETMDSTTTKVVSSPEQEQPPPTPPPPPPPSQPSDTLSTTATPTSTDDTKPEEQTTTDATSTDTGSINSKNNDLTNDNSSNNQLIKEEDVVVAANERLLKIKKLKAKLINEEHRLVLMKKIRQSQTRPLNQQQQQLQNQQQQQKVATSQHQQHLNNSNTAGNSSAVNNLMNHIPNQSPNPAKKLRPNSLSGLSAGGLTGGLTAANLSQLGQLGQQAKNLLLSNSNSLSQVSSAAAAAALNQTPAHAHQRPKNNALWSQPNQQQARQPTPAGIAPPHVGNLNRPPITTPPNVVQAMMGGLSANQQSLLMNQINALTANAAAAAAITSNTGINNKRPIMGNISRQQAITTPPNVVQDTRLGLSGQQQQLSSTPQASGRRAHINNMSRQPMTTPPNMISEARSSLSGQQSLLMSNMSTSSPTSSRSRGVSQQMMGGQQSMTPQHQSPQASGYNKSQAAQMLLQKRQAAKSSIQKQLEQTLMQLPEKRIQLGIDFIPNANNIEFVYYIGLEACVDYLTNSKNPLDAPPLEKPFECSTCGTDFTPAWSWKRSNPVCENCVSNHVKRSIKNSQTGRIKSVLAKAAKQEQEMDQRIMAEATNVVSSQSSTPTTSTSQRHSSLLQPITQTPPQRSTPQSSSSAWPRVNPSPHTSGNRSSAAPSLNTTTSAANILPNLNLNNPLAAFGNLPPAALASLLQMNPNMGSLASLMTVNAAPTTATNNNNQIAQVAALLMNQLTMNLWNKR